MMKWRGQTAKRLQVRAPRQLSRNCGTHEKITESDPHSRIRSCQTEKYVTQKCTPKDKNPYDKRTKAPGVSIIAVNGATVATMLPLCVQQACGIRPHKL